MRTGVVRAMLDRWLRRSWRPDAAALARLPQRAPAVVITGASDGIGRALAGVVAAEGHRVVLVARTAGRLAEAAHAIQKGGSLSPASAPPLVVSLDVTLPDSHLTLDRHLAEAGLYCDVLVNCAGIGQAGAFAVAAPETLGALTAVNVEAPTRLARHVLPDMLVRGRGGILNFASLGGYMPGPYQAAYYASKAYVISLTEALALEVRGQGVRVAVVSPGPVATQFHDRMAAGAALYRNVGLTMSPQAVARSAWRGYCMSRTVIVPGVLPTLLAVVSRVVPHPVLVPIVAILLRPRGSTRDVER